MDSLPIRIAERGLSQAQLDPVSAFRFSSDPQRRFVCWINGNEVVALRAGNSAGKTKVGSMLGVALARGCRSLGGERLPFLSTPNVGLVLVKARDQANESTIRAYQEAIGDWPHREERVGGALKSLWVKPNGSRTDDYRKWSRIMFFVEEGQSLEGMRLDWAHADEPPSKDDWAAVCGRRKANRPFPKFMTFTPIYRAEWEWLRKYLLGHGEPGSDGIVEVRMSIRDNDVLSKEHIEAMIREWSAVQPEMLDAKINGDWIDVSGACPFSSAGLARWESRAEKGVVEQVRLSSGRMVEVECWPLCIPGDRCMSVCDLSAGMDDGSGHHDPACMGIVSRVTGRLLARYNGYLEPYSMGELASRYCIEYRDANAEALNVFEDNGGWGDAFVLGVRDYRKSIGLYGYGNLYAKPQPPLGSNSVTGSWNTNRRTRGVLIGALQHAVTNDLMDVRSLAAIESLRDVRHDWKGRPEASKGRHDEDMIVLGLAAHLIETLPVAPIVRSAVDEFRSTLSPSRTREDENAVDWT